MKQTNEKVAYISPQISENYLSPEGVLCASQWNVEQDNMTYEKYEW